MRRSQMTHLALFTLLALGFLLGTGGTVSASTSAEVDGSSAIPESTDAGSTAGEQTMEGERAPKPKHQPSFFTCMSIKNDWVLNQNSANRYWDAGNQTAGDGAHNAAMASLDDWWNLCYSAFGPMGEYIDSGELTK